VDNFTKYFAFFILIIILVTNSISLAQSYNFTNENSEPIYSISINLDEIKSSDEKHHFTVLARTEENYNYILNNYNIFAAFPNLKIVIIESSVDAAKKLLKKVPFIDYSENLVGNLKIPDFYTHDSKISLNAIIDANVMRVKDMWELGYTGRNVSIGMLDNGVELDHPGLGGNVIEEVWFETDGVGVRTPFHGTPVAGTMVGVPFESYTNNFGNAYNSTVYSAALRSGQGGSFIIGASGTHYLAAFDYFVSIKDEINLINFSGGGSSHTALDVYISEILEENNILLVAAAGNSGRLGAPVTTELECPSCQVNSLSVGAVDMSNGQRAVFSSRGPGPVPGLKPDVMAPGRFVTSTQYSGEGGGLKSYQGTSFSAPLTTAALAVLIDALETNNYSWNIGTLKSAIIEGAKNSSLGTQGYQYSTGAGLVNLIASWHYLTQNNNGTYANALTLTPDSDKPFRKQNEVTSFFQGISSEIPGYTIITSNASDVSFSIFGNITDILSVGDLNPNRYSQYLPLTINTKEVSQGLYKGVLVATLGNLNQTISFEYLVGDPPRGLIGFDRYHTDWDDLGANTLDGTNTGEAVKSWIEEDFWVEDFDEPLTSELLSKYDILWIPDPVNKVLFQGNDFTQEEIDSLIEYVNSGGSVFITFNGPYYLSGVQGVDADKINQLIKNWGINSYANPNLGNVQTHSLDLHNRTSFVGSAKKVTHAGNYLFLDHKMAHQSGGVLEYYTGTEDKTTIASFTKKDGGRVVVTSTNFWADNKGVTGGYAADGDPILVKNLVDWLTSSNKLSLPEKQTSTSNITAIIYSENGIIPEVKRLKTFNLAERQFAPEFIDQNQFTFEYLLYMDGIHQIQISNGNEYVRLEQALDLRGPYIIPTEDNEFGKVFSSNLNFIRLSFLVKDSVYDMRISNIMLYVDGQLVNSALFPRTYQNDILNVNVDRTRLNNGLAYHNLTIEAKDDLDQTTRYQYIFYFGMPSKFIDDPNPTEQLPQEEVTEKIETSPNQPSAGFLSLIFFQISYGIAVIYLLKARKTK
jgi:hypothetical protein